MSGTLIIKSNMPLNHKDYETFYNSFQAQHAVGTVLIPVGFDIVYIPEDSNIKIEKVDNNGRS